MLVSRTLIWQTRIFGNREFASPSIRLDAQFFTVTAGNFNATEQLLILNGGIASLPAAAFTQNFATTPLNIPGAGTGSLTSTLNNGIFDLAFSMPINNTQVLQGQNLTIVGSIVATGQVTAVPEPGSIVLCGLAAIGGLAVRRRAAVRRKQSAK